MRNQARTRDCGRTAASAWQDEVWLRAPAPIGPSSIYLRRTAARRTRREKNNQCRRHVEPPLKHRDLLLAQRGIGRFGTIVSPHCKGFSVAAHLRGVGK